MAAISATTVQKTFKPEALTIYAEGSVDALGDITLLTSEGQSIGIKEIVHDGLGLYSVYLVPTIAVANYMGVVSIQHISGAQPGPTYNILINNIGPGVDNVFDIRVYESTNSSGDVVDPAATLTDFGVGSLRITLTVSTNRAL
jgi:hypothetical protein